MGKSSDPIYEKLKNEIVMLEIKPGTMLKEVDIGERFNVSRTPARDVFVRLQRDHLVEVVSQKGTYVTKINIEDVTDIMYLRKTIEENIISSLIKKISLDQINILHLILIHQKEILEIEDEQERRVKFYENDKGFIAFIGDKDTYTLKYTGTTLYKVTSYIRTITTIILISIPTYKFYKKKKS